MAHYPLNHPLRPLYRLLAFLAAAYLTLFGAIGVGVTAGDPLFHRGGDWVLGLRTNPATAWVSLLLGVVLLVAVVVGRNLYHQVALVLGWALAGFAMVVMAVIQTDANVFNFSMINVVVLALLGLVVLTAGLYGKIGRPDDEAAR
ncbi:hypothetical protein Aab01nite_24230 [Paractinoplanes abujensis]|uniref:Peptidoglycan/LPS O-acetylase OafA/YrhL n=1 Tax=Paractinoplanes abujensis TaxID=882441 RepID=A0A7W7CXY7_9ACTN|nr:DUF4383 domain-containing protein [Actinoplanes abujensis]MBB4696703.1 peptidoglycan/LPS O-acetylase OafA/YrhL [Actinoplanes abujensis]GID18833.1 hypothetical protein Aab01nite_24230 [Actinoplanes abujensis]